MITSKQNHHIVLIGLMLELFHSTAPFFQIEIGFHLEINKVEIVKQNFVHILVH